MLGLSGYGSSDDEIDASQTMHATKGKDKTIKDSVIQPQVNGDAGLHSASANSSRVTDAKEPVATQLDTSAPVAGPQVGPSMPSGEVTEQAEDSSAVPLSPYSSARQAVRTLTLPPVPNFNIPPSPPGSPPPGSTEKFARFLELKKKGVHFNEKLENSSALRNPSLLQKLRDFAGISDEEQYASGLPQDLALPTKFPAWAFADSLNRMQTEATKSKEKARTQQGRDAIDFVPSSAASGTPRVSGRETTTKTSGGSGTQSAAERVMAGLDKGKPGVLSSKKRPDTGQHRSRFDAR